MIQVSVQEDRKTCKAAEFLRLDGMWGNQISLRSKFWWLSIDPLPRNKKVVFDLINQRSNSWIKQDITQIYPNDIASHFFSEGGYLNTLPKTHAIATKTLFLISLPTIMELVQGQVPLFPQFE